MGYPMEELSSTMRAKALVMDHDWRRKQANILWEEQPWNDMQHVSSRPQAHGAPFDRSHGPQNTVIVSPP